MQQGIFSKRRYIKAFLEMHISSCTNPRAKKMNECIRGHWAIENRLHWNLDVIIGEDDSRRRVGHATKNYNLVLKMALTQKKDVKKYQREGK
ncbi:MAG: hypothetical protein ACKVOM_07230 [Ferruginibacter sp.]